MIPAPRSIFLFLQLVLSLNLSATGFYTKDGQHLVEYDDIWSFVNHHVGSCPSKIIFEQDLKNGSFSRFNGFPPRIILAKPKDHKDFKMIFTHETSHVCLFNKTKQMSNKERFRFFDEGLADMIGGRFVDGEKWYKKTAFKRAKQKVLNNKVSFELVQQWKNYFGEPPNVDFDAYMVGATFNYFIIETFGKEKLESFFVSIGETESLDRSIQETFSLSLKDLEKQWLSYIRAF